MTPDGIADNKAEVRKYQFHQGTVADVSPLLINTTRKEDGFSLKWLCLALTVYKSTDRLLVLTIGYISAELSQNGFARGVAIIF